MALYRFVTLDGWQRWIDIAEIPPPRSYAVLREDRYRRRSFADPISIQEPIGHKCVFYQTTLRWPETGDETVYVEEDMPIDTIDEKFFEHSPSLHGETYWKTRLQSAADTMDAYLRDLDTSGGSGGQRIHRLLALVAFIRVFVKRSRVKPV